MPVLPCYRISVRELHDFCHSVTCSLPNWCSGLISLFWGCVAGRWAWAQYSTQGRQKCKFSSRDLGLKLLELQSLLGAKRQITEKAQSLRDMQLKMKCPKVSLRSAMLNSFTAVGHAHFRLGLE